MLGLTETAEVEESEKVGEEEAPRPSINFVIRTLVIAGVVVIIIVPVILF